FYDEILMRKKKKQTATSNKNNMLYLSSLYLGGTDHELKN
ncbi:uncharacterized protein METZ01_LOCUS469779, partial [marine metagenome]